MQEHEISLMISNSRDKEITFILEPWGEIYPMEPHACFTVVFRSPVQPHDLNTIEVEYGADSITVYGWEGCTAFLFHNGEELGGMGITRPRVPKIPGE